MRGSKQNYQCRKWLDKKNEEQGFILENIEVWKLLPALYNVKSKDYGNRQEKNDVYAILFDKYRDRYLQANRKDVTKTFNSIDTNFWKQMKIINSSGGGGGRGAGWE
jgi:hypothetical protein